MSCYAMLCYVPFLSFYELMLLGWPVSWLFTVLELPMRIIYCSHGPLNKCEFAAPESLTSGCLSSFILPIERCSPSNFMYNPDLLIDKIRTIRIKMV